jgi:virginiamycin B lyase
MKTLQAIALSMFFSGAAVCDVSPEVVSKQYALPNLPIVERIKVQVGPGWLAVGFGSVWVTKIDSHLVLRIDPVTDKIIAKIPVGSDPELGIGMGMGFAWIADIKDHAITEVDPRTNRVARIIPVNIAADPEGSMGVGEGSIWVLTSAGGTDSGTLTRIDAVTGKIVANIPVRQHSHAAIVAFGSVWVSSAESGTVTRVDPRSNSVLAEVSVHASPRFLIANKEAIWVLCQSDGSLIRVDPTSNRVTAAIAVGVPGDGGDLSVDDRYVWVSAEGVPLSQIDPGHNRLIRQFVGGKKDDTMRVGFGYAWVLDELRGEIWKVDLNRLEKLPNHRD